MCVLVGTDGGGQKSVEARSIVTRGRNVNLAALANLKRNRGFVWRVLLQSGEQSGGVDSSGRTVNFLASLRDGMVGRHNVRSGSQ